MDAATVCVGMCEGEVLQRVAELWCWLMDHTHREQKYLGVSGSVSYGTVVVHEKPKVKTKAPGGHGDIRSWIPPCEASVIS